MNEPGYFHLNLENAWPQVRRSGLAVDADGTLRLGRVPQADAPLTAPLPPAAVAGLAGLGVDDEGNLYIADPGGHKILRWVACDGSLSPLACLAGPGALPGQLRTPRGVLAGPRGRLYVADSGNHRIQVVDLRTLQLRGIWGQAVPYDAPQPGQAPGQFDDPWDLAADTAGHVYVVDHGNRRVQRFDLDGHVDADFWETLSAQPVVPGEPVAATAAVIDGAERLLIVDQAPPRVLAYALDGTYEPALTQRWQALAFEVAAGIAYGDDMLYVGDAAAGQVLAVDTLGRFAGAVRGYHGPVAGLALDCQGRLVVNPGAGGAVTRLVPGAAYLEAGSFLAGPYTMRDRPVAWHRVKVAGTLPAGCHLQLFTYTAAVPDVPPPPGPDALTDIAAAPAGTWRAAPRDELDALVLNAAAPYLWVACTLQGDGAQSPAVAQIRVEYEHETWLRYLPALYQRDEPARTFLERSLGLFESALGDVEALLDDLPRRFDPQAAPDDPPDSWLDWLAGWLAFDLDEDWSRDQRRGALAGAFDLLSRRGTAASLRRFIALYAGVPAAITEPARDATLWSLGETSHLGFTTMLAPAQAQGAVMGTSAFLDRSHLIDEAEYGAPLFEDLAHRFCVQIYAADLARRSARQQVSNEFTDPAPETQHGPEPGGAQLAASRSTHPLISSESVLDRVRAVVDREKPAHTDYHLCVIGARMRVGFQARIGVDTIVAGPPPDLVLSAAGPLGTETRLPETPGDDQALGRAAHVGLRL